MRIHFVGGFAAIAFTSSFALIGCSAKSPEKACAQLDQLYGESKDWDTKEECVKDLTEIKDKAPTGFRCLSAALDEHRDRKDFGKALDRCVDNDKALQGILEEQDKRRRAKIEKADLEGMDSWPKLKDKAFSQSVAGTAFKITLAEGFTEEKESYEMMRSYQFEQGGKLMATLSITTGFSDLESTIKARETVSEVKVTKKENTDTGWILHSEDEFGLSVLVQVTVGDKKLDCSAKAFGKPAIAKRDVLGPWLEKMCKSLAAG